MSFELYVPEANAGILPPSLRWGLHALMFLLGSLLCRWYLSNRGNTRPLDGIPYFALLGLWIAYVVMALGMGWALGPTRRPIWLARYIVWCINTPLTLLSVLSFSSLPTPKITLVLFSACASTFCDLAGTLMDSPYKWGMHCLSRIFLGIVWYFLFSYCPSCGFRDEEHRRCFMNRAFYISIVSSFYPGCRALAETNTISPLLEQVAFATLDVLHGPVFFLMFFEYPFGGNQGNKDSKVKRVSRKTS